MKKLITCTVVFFISIFAVFGQIKPIKVACLGNSITQGPGRDHEDSYPLQLQDILGEKFKVKNFGVSGRTLLKKGDFPYWNEPQLDEVKVFSPDILVIKLGTNDSKPQNWQFKTEFKEDYLDLIASLRANMPSTGKIFICLPVPVFQDNWGINEKILVQEMRPILMEIARESGATVIDLYNPLKAYPKLFPDGVHPNKEGLGIMAEIVAKAIKK